MLETLHLEYLAMKRYGETLPLPSSVKRLIILGESPTFDLSRVPQLTELEVDYSATLHGQGFDNLHHLEILRICIPKALSASSSFKVLLANNAATLKELRLRGMDTFEQQYPLPQLRTASILSDKVVLKQMPELVNLTISAKKCTAQQYPKLVEFTAYKDIDLQFLRASPHLQKIYFYASVSSGFTFPDLPSLKELVIKGMKDLSFLPALENLSTLTIERSANEDTVPKHLLCKVQR